MAQAAAAKKGMDTMNEMALTFSDIINNPSRGVSQGVNKLNEGLRLTNPILGTFTQVITDIGMNSNITQAYLAAMDESVVAAGDALMSGLTPMLDDFLDMASDTRLTEAATEMGVFFGEAYEAVRPLVDTVWEGIATNVSGIGTAFKSMKENVNWDAISKNIGGITQSLKDFGKMAGINYDSIGLNIAKLINAFTSLGTRFQEIVGNLPTLNDRYTGEVGGNVLDWEMDLAGVNF